MSADEKRDSSNQPRYEGEAILLDGRVKNLEREGAETKEEDQRYKNAQLKINSQIAAFNLLLVICTAALGGISIWQATIAQTAATAAKDAAKAASDNALIAYWALMGNQESAVFTLQQMEGQTAAQIEAAKASKSAANTSKEALVSVQRAYLFFTGDFPATKTIEAGKTTSLRVNVTLDNSGTTPSRHARSHFNWRVFLGDIPKDTAVRGNFRGERASDLELA